MSQPLNIFTFGFALLLLSFLGIAPLKTTDDLQEVRLPPTICSVPVIAPSFNLSSIRTHYISKQEVHVEVAVHLQHPGIVGLSDKVKYNITLRPVDDWHSAAVNVATGSATVKHQARLSVRFPIPRQDAAVQKSWELEVYANSESSVGSSSGLDRVYLSFIANTSDTPSAILLKPAEYWQAKTTELNRSIITLPKIESETKDGFEHDEKSGTLSQSLRPQRPQPDDPLPPRRRLPLSIRVLYEDPNGIKRGLANARVDLYTDPFAPQATWSYKLDSAGRVNDILVYNDDLVPYAAKLSLDDPLFSIKQGTTETNTVLWQYDLNFGMTKDRLTITGDLVRSIGPDIGHVWSEFHRIRNGGDTTVGLSGVPHVDIWFPCSGPDCDPHCDGPDKCKPANSYYRPGGNRIALNTVHSKTPEVLSHEYGHHVMHSLMPGGIPANVRKGDHTLCSTDANDAMAWVEGYATAFGLQATGQRIAFGLDLEDLSCPANRDMLTSEGRVAAGMLDLMDTGTAPECSGGDEKLGRPRYCDRTTGTLFTPYVVLRQSIAKQSFASVVRWWESLSGSLRAQVGLVDGWDAMRYNYYPLPPCRRRWRGICLDSILDPTLVFRPRRWELGPNRSERLSRKEEL